MKLVNREINNGETKKKNSTHTKFFDNIKKKISKHQMKVLNINKNKIYFKTNFKLNSCLFVFLPV